MMFDIVPLARTQVAAGKVRALAVASPQRLAAVPDVPTVAEAGFPELEGGPWFGLLAPAGTPATIVAKLNDAVAEAARSNEVVTGLRAQGIEPAHSRPEQFAVFVREQLDLHRKLAEEVDLRLAQ